MGGLLRIAVNEAARYVRVVSPRAALGLALVAILATAAWPHLARRGLEPETGLYRVEIDDASPFLPVVRSDPRFDVSLGPGGRFLTGEADLHVLGDRVRHLDNAKGAAAARELRLATSRWLDASMAEEPDGEAAFPVAVNLVYVPRAAAPPLPPAPPGANGSGTSAPSPEPRLVALPGDHEERLTPYQVEPPFPMRSLLLTFAYLIPLNVVGQLQAGALWAERVRERGLLVLSAPHRPSTILLGKVLPHAVLLVLLSLLITLLLGAGVQGFLAILPVLAFGLASSVLFGLVARSPRELTFLLVASTVLLSTFLFLPAIFTQIHPVSYLSPITVLVEDLRGDETPAGPFLYATLPLAAASAAFLAVALALYREESLFAPARLGAKIADALHRLAPGPGRLLATGAALVPFTVGLELFLLIFAVTLDLRTAFVVFLLGGAFVEEAFKALPLHAHRTRGGRLGPVLLGLLVGGGFFLGEKLALVFSLVGFGALPHGADALVTFGVAPTPLLVVAPFVLHVATATITAHAAGRGKARLALGWLASSLVHAAYNAAVVRGALGDEIP